MSDVLVYGLAVAGEATARALLDRGATVIAVDDSIDDERTARADGLGVELVVTPDDEHLERLVAACDLVVPAPGVPEHHRLFAIAASAGRRVVSELELAYDWEQQRPGGPRPMLTVTGTDGKTTTTLLAVEMLTAGGLRSVAAGNTDVPLVTAVGDDSLDVFVVECTSFRLAWTERFRGDAAAWLNLAPDHLNWHRSLDSYIAAKARLFTQQRPDDVAIGYADDPVVAAHLADAPGRAVSFAGLDSTSAADYHVVGSGPDAELVGPNGSLARVDELARALPHDLTNGLAAAALVRESGLVDESAIATALAEFRGPPHRIEFVGEISGVAYYNDSKATTPHAAAAAIGAFHDIVLIAGGRNKDLDLTAMADAASGRVRHVVAVGDAADEIAALFSSRPAVLVERASSMSDALDVAGAAARPGDVVLLSPGCASFDWYRNYEARGDDFRGLVHERMNP